MYASKNVVNILKVQVGIFQNSTTMCLLGLIELLDYKEENISCSADWSNQFKFLMDPELEHIFVDILFFFCSYDETFDHKTS